MKALIAGDTHGSYQLMRHLIARALENEVDLIIQVGDFGYIWNNLSNLDDIEAMLAKAGVSLFWLDGNHENYSLMSTLGIGPNDDPLTVIRPHVTYLPRGRRFRLGSLNCMAFGGAVSVDRNSRMTGRSWWSQEAITTQQVDRVTATTGEVDVLFTHDSPDNVPEMDTHLQMLEDYDPYRWPADALRESEWNRKLLGEVVDFVKPKVLYHGHMHHRYDGVRRLSGSKADLTAIVGLGCDFADMWVILDTENLPSVDAR